MYDWREESQSLSLHRSATAAASAALKNLDDHESDAAVDLQLTAAAVAGDEKYDGAGSASAAAATTPTAAASSPLPHRAVMSKSRRIRLAAAASEAAELLQSVQTPATALLLTRRVQQLQAEEALLRASMQRLKAERHLATLRHQCDEELQTYQREMQRRHRTAQSVVSAPQHLEKESHHPPYRNADGGADPTVGEDAEGAGRASLLGLPATADAGAAVSHRPRRMKMAINAMAAKRRKAMSMTHHDRQAAAAATVSRRDHRTAKAATSCKRQTTTSAAVVKGKRAKGVADAANVKGPIQLRHRALAVTSHTKKQQPELKKQQRRRTKTPRPTGRLKVATKAIKAGKRKTPVVSKKKGQASRPTADSEKRRRRR